MSVFVNILDIVYPVGSIYQSMEPTSPSEIIGGTWEQIKTFLMGADESKLTGGEATHTLTTQEMPSHSHGLNNCITNNSGSTAWNLMWGHHGAASGALSTDAAGGGQAHNNLPPYTTCYIWYRVA